MIPAHFVPDPQYIKILERKKEVISNLCDAAKAYLLVDIETTLSTKDDPIPTFPNIPNPHFTLERLVQLQSDRTRIDEQISSVERLVDSVPKNVAGYFETVIMDMLKEKARSLDMQIQEVQAYLDMRSKT